MTLINIVLACVLSFFSTAIMSYIAMATAIGPWTRNDAYTRRDAYFVLLRRWYTAKEKGEALGLTAAAGVSVVSLQRHVVLVFLPYSLSTSHFFVH